MKKLLIALTALSTFAAGTAVAATGSDALAARLAELRTEVEALSSDVEAKKEEKRTRLRSLSAQKADLEFQLQREERRIAELRARAERQRETMSKDTTVGNELKPALDEAMDDLEARIQAGLPFKRAERLEAVAELRRKIDQGLLTPQKGAVQLWALFEDEMRLGRENGLYRQVIELGGDEVLVDVARLGMVTMYFRTDDGRVGRVVQGGDGAASHGWTWVETASERDQRQVAALFDAMRKQIRTGYFELPGGEL